MEEAVLEPDGELCVSVPIQNPTCEPICLTSRDILGQMQPVTIMPKPEVVAALVEGDTKVTSNHTGEPIDSNPQDTHLLKDTHIEESLSVEEIQQLNELIIEFPDVFALDSSELGITRHGGHHNAYQSIKVHYSASD